MSISKDDLLKRREEIVTDYNNAVAEIAKGESQIKEMKNNLNALAGALQQTDLFLKQIAEDGDEMPPEKAFALDMATSQEITMVTTRIIEEKEEESNSMIHETLTTNPRDVVVEVETPDESTEKEKKENEKL